MSLAERSPRLEAGRESVPPPRLLKRESGALPFSPSDDTSSRSQRSAALPRARVAPVALSAPERAVAVNTPPNDDALEERALLLAVQRGETQAFDTLVRRYMRRAFAVAFRLLGHREDAEDLVQDAFLLALEQIHTYDVERPFAPWFFRLLTNRGLNARRARSIRYMDSIPEDTSAHEADAEEQLLRSEVKERFAAALAELPERQRLIVTLAEVDGLSRTEIAAMLDLSPGTVRWYLHEARHKLRRTLAPLHEGETEEDETEEGETEEGETDDR